MSDEQPSKASRLIVDGAAKLEEQLFDSAILSFKDAQRLFDDSGDDVGSLEALTRIIAALIAKGDCQDALTMAQEKRVQFQAKWNLTAEICMLEQILNAHAAMLDVEAVEKTARKGLEKFKEYEACGMDTAAGQALMWLSIAKACLAKRESDEAMNAAEMACKLCADIGNYEFESLAVRLYNQADEQKGKTTYRMPEQIGFYLGVRVGGIAYGPRYRDNHCIMVRQNGAPHVACCLQLTALEGEDWEHEVGFNPALIDAGGHAGFANSYRADSEAAAAEAAADPNYVPPGPNIPFLMDHAECRARKDGSDMYVNIADTQVYMFTR